jgi:hypothetical protein
MVDPNSMPSKNTPSAFDAYWTAYGGWKALIRSSYLWISLAPVVWLWPAWVPKDSKSSGAWVELAFQVIPSVISFSLGALAIIISLSSGAFLKIIQERGSPTSLYMQMVAAFFHFILVQFVCIMIAVIAKFILWDYLSFFGFWVFCYALSCGVAAAVSLVGLAQLRNKSSNIE